MQEQISDDTATSPEVMTVEATTASAPAERPDTTYVILADQGDGVWEVVHPAMPARSTREALQTYVEGLKEKPEYGTVLVAVASRSWKPVPVGIRTETITRVVIGE